MPFFFYDPTFILLLPALALAVYAQLKVSRTFNRYAQVPSARGMTGAGVAAELLRRRGIRDAKVGPVQGRPHQGGSAPLALRSAIVPVAQFGTMAAWILFLLGLLLSRPLLMDLGILFFLGYVLFSLVTLPVEFNASSSAVQG